MFSWFSFKTYITYFSFFLLKLTALYTNTFPVFILEFCTWSVFSLSSLLFFWLCSSDLAVSRFGWFFHVLHKSWFLNVTDDCVGFRASSVSCQIVKAIIPPQAAGVTIQHCWWEDSPAAWRWQIVLSVIPFPPSQGHPEITAGKANLLQWICHQKHVNIYESSKGLATQE